MSEMARQDVEALRKALDWGGHHTTCASVMLGEDCDCGHGRALAALARLQRELDEARRERADLEQRMDDEIVAHGKTEADRDAALEALGEYREQFNKWSEREGPACLDALAQALAWYADHADSEGNYDGKMFGDLRALAAPAAPEEPSPLLVALRPSAETYDYLTRTIATIRNHKDADNCWPQWANALADEVERMWTPCLPPTACAPAELRWTRTGARLDTDR